MIFAVESHKGMMRDVNQDSFSIIEGDDRRPYFFIIADGMGGHNSGELASKMAVECVEDFLAVHTEKLKDLRDIPGLLTEIVKKANYDIYIKSQQDITHIGMGTTLVISALWQGKIYIANIGDSRTYTVRNSEIKKVTTDHSFIEELIMSGAINRQEALSHPSRHIITRALGCSSFIEADIYTLDLEKSDIIIMCTDGLTNMLTEEEIMKEVESTEDPGAVCKALVNKANERGGLDNTTVIIIKIGNY